MRTQKLFGHFLLIAFTVALSGCGGWDPEIVKPTRPASVHGWQKYETESLTIKGQFVLSKGESTDNGHVGIRVVDIYAAKYHLLDSPELPRAKVQFFRVPDQTIICEGIFERGGNRLDLPDLCKDNLAWTVIYINGINHSESWVFFDLR
jgi:hypothetical protein